MVRREYETKAREKIVADFVDLGLSSGTLWAGKGEEGYFSVEELISLYGNFIPSPEQFIELRKECKWVWRKDGTGYDITGPNGNTLFLQASGYLLPDGTVRLLNRAGLYWTNRTLPYGNWVHYPKFYFVSKELCKMARGDNNHCLSAHLVLSKLNV